jgi:hypothetical protein
MSKITLTFQEKVLLHLLDFANIGDQFEYPEEITQKGVANAVCMQRKHIPRILKKLVSNELAREDQGHVKEHAQRMKIYFLTWKGIEKSKKLKSHLEEKTVQVRDDKGKLCGIKLCDVNDFYNGRFTILDIINNQDDAGVFGGILEPSEDDLMEEERLPPGHEIYRHTLLQVWKDGKASMDEKEILDELRKILKISEEDHTKMEEKIIKYAYPVRRRLLEIYEAAYRQALKDKKITQDERAILEKLRDKLGIDPKDIEKIEGKYKD